MRIQRLFGQLMKLSRNYYTVQSDKTVKSHYEVAKHIRSKIVATGPITVAQYMKDILISPIGGYYMYKDAIGTSGDFITSPELSQVFGELIAVWFLNEWSKAGSPKPIQIVELGPGRGTLCQDILRVFAHFGQLDNATIHLVEISPHLSELQAKRLVLQSEVNISNKDNSIVYQQGKGIEGVPISWYKHLNDVPHAFTLLIAHEFFDALPIHKFEKTKEGYREVLIDVDQAVEDGFRFVLSNGDTPASKLFINSNETRRHVEISPESLVLIQDISRRIEFDGGIALIADYGHEGGGEDTFRAFKKHQLHDPLVDPGTADITADVDFAALKEVAVKGNGVLAFGPIPQRSFLINMGIEYRLKDLEKYAEGQQKENLNYSYKMLVDEDKMGKRFKFMALLPATLEAILKKYPISGF